MTGTSIGPVAERFLEYINPLVVLVEQWAYIIGIVSFGVFAGSLVITIWMILSLPADFWQERDSDSKEKNHPAISLLRNILAVALFPAGLIMLVMPGQGILTLLAAFLVSDFPFRKKIINKLLDSPRIERGLNRIRRRFGKEPFRF